PHHTLHNKRRLWRRLIECAQVLECFVQGFCGWLIHFGVWLQTRLPLKCTNCPCSEVTIPLRLLLPCQSILKKLLLSLVHVNNLLAQQQQQTVLQVGNICTLAVPINWRGNLFHLISSILDEPWSS